jgi:hypothetical protein
MKKFLYLILSLLVYVAHVDAYKAKLINLTDIQADFSVRTTLSGCCDESCDVNSECTVPVASFSEGVYDMSTKRSICSGACWKCISVTGKNIVFKFTLKRSDLGSSFTDSKLNIIACGNIRAFLYRNHDKWDRNDGKNKGKIELGNKNEYIASLNVGLDNLLKENKQLANSAFIKDLIIKYKNKVKELENQLSTDAFASNSLPIENIIAADNLLYNTVDYAQEYAYIDKAIQAIKNKPIQGQYLAADKLKELADLQEYVDSTPRKNALIEHDNMLQILSALIYLARLDASAQDKDKKLLVLEIKRDLKFPRAKELQKEIADRIAHTKQLYPVVFQGMEKIEQDSEIQNPSKPSSIKIPTAVLPPKHFTKPSMLGRSSLPTILEEEENDEPVHQWWIAKLATSMNYPEARNEICDIKKYIEGGELAMKARLSQQSPASDEVKELKNAIDTWRKQDKGNPYVPSILKAINERLEKNKWRCSQ